MKYRLPPWLGALAAVAESARGCGLEAQGAWIAEPPPGVAVLAGYVTLRNGGDREVILTGADSPAFGRIEFHALKRRERAWHMQREAELRVPPHGELALVPGKLHLMLFQPGQEFHPGDQVAINLQCGTGRQRVPFAVVAP
ncbi:copper chaperone PCu(A)C [Candidatus Methylocalor cossyra]|uniref:Copper metallochaperone, bacterial analog of Cox17 protein n=1 Tax=Candidatus Methylocalor cossyra TaxID=3108543 RepID=A0ABM9NEI4_9GAMM